jgi:hypothetical protein
MVRNCLKTLDFGFRRNDGKWYFLTFYETIRSFLIAFADHCVPDTVGDSRKVSSFIAGFGKHVPDRVIPQEPIDNWANIKLKLHVSTLLSKGRDEAHR